MYRNGIAKVFGCDLRAYDALVVLKDEALPRAGQRLQPSALQVWIGTAEAEKAEPCSSLGIEANETSKRSRAIVSHIPRKAARTVPLEALAEDVLVGIDPVAKLCEDLESRIGHCAVVNADEWGGQAIGIKWRPQAFEPGPFRVATAHTLAPTESGEYAVDKLAVFQDILHCGEGIVDDILVCKR